MEPRFGDLQSFSLKTDVLTRDFEQHFVFAYLRIGVRDLRRDRHEGVIVVRDRAHHGGVRGLDVTPVAAPEVDLPGGVEADGIVGKSVGGQIRLVRSPLADVVPGRGARAFLLLREHLPDSDPELCAGFENA